jgi:hypothetical protein
MDRLKAAIDSDPVLQEAIDTRIVFGIPKVHPAVYVDGVYASNDKQNRYNFNINLTYAKVTGSIEDAVTFFDLAERLKVALTASRSIVGGSWVDRSGETIHRALFDCHTWL